MIVAVIGGIYLKVKHLDRGYEIITLTTFCWLTMSWGGYVGGISIVLFISIRSFINNELEFLKTKQTDMTKEIPRIMLVTIVASCCLVLMVGSTWPDRRILPPKRC